MSPRLVIPMDISERVAAYFDAGHERMLFLLVETEQDDMVVVDELYLVDRRDYAYQGRFGMELADDVRPRVLAWATPTGRSLVEVHAHLGSGQHTSFSPTDLEGLATVVPQMLWRLPGRSYAALVLGNHDLDALFWKERGALPQTFSTVVLGDRSTPPTRIALDDIATEE